MAHQKLLLFWLWMFLLSLLCPCTHCKRGGGRGWGKSGGLPARAPPSQSKGSSKQGLKIAGAAAAGALGGAAVGYGLGSLGRPRYGHGHGGYSDDDRHYYHGGPGALNQTDWRSYRNSGTSRHAAHLLVPLAAVAHVLLSP